MSRVEFFQSCGLIVNRIYNVPRLTREIIHENRNGPKDSILIYTGYKDADGNYEYLSVSGKTHKELTPIIDQNMKELTPIWKS